MDVLVENENKAKEDAEHARSKLTAAIQTESRLADILQNAKNRKETCTEEEVQWQRRLEGVTNRIKELKERLENGKKEQDRLEIRPENIQAHILEIGDKLEAADNARQKASDKLLIAEKKLEKADISQREADKGLTSAREEQIRAESTKEYCNTIIGEIENHIRDKFDCNPNEISSIAEITIHEKLSDIKVLEERLNRLLRERDNMGPVNLRADKEMEELAAKIKDMENEQADLGGAILKLREAISQLNREGRGRLLASFKEVDKHFKLLFKKLFGGGTAELRLTDSSDPLDAGLEIMASPPGKRLQSLSLLSGGEQALTALAMIFAVFQTNPAPICVLDEVDAPLDDSNVSRFCDLLQSICDQTQTRFLVVTHHRMTMARMDRLFGITMEKRGISKLVSVDLQTAEKIRDNLIA